MSKTNLSWKPPTVPNFLALEMPPGTRKDGIQELPKIRIADLTPIERDRLAAMYREELDRVAERQEKASA